MKKWRVFGANEVNVASVVKMREIMNVDLLNVGNGLMNNNAHMNVNDNMRMIDDNWMVRGVNAVPFVSRSAGCALRSDNDGNHVHHNDGYVVTTRKTAHAFTPHDHDGSCEHGNKGPKRGQAGLRVLARANEESARCGRGAPGVSCPIIDGSPGDFCERTFFADFPDLFQTFFYIFSEFSCVVT